MITLYHDGSMSSEETLRSTPVSLATFAALQPDRPSLTNGGGGELRDLVMAEWSDRRVPLFQILALETRTGCNLTCSFCPVSRESDQRPYSEMPISTMIAVLSELSQLNYSGSILLFSNNEPLLDDRIVEIVSLSRTHCPEARIKILSNGTRLSINLASDLFDAGLTVLEIDNYSDGRRLIRPVQDLINSAALFDGVDIRINMRRLHETLTNRAGTAPNKAPLAVSRSQFCALPFTDITVVPDGRVTLCCFDAYEVTTFGTIHDSSLVDIWTGDAFRRVRTSLSTLDRSCNGLCAVCDYDGFRIPRPTQWIDLRVPSAAPN
jgi:MoaA/NifB/PqqE/SkfB family radical SAM enzyme